MKWLITIMGVVMATNGAYAEMKPEHTKQAIFAGGCFWCTESVFDDFKGVVSAKPGYIGGKVDNPSYEDVSTGSTGHIEAVVVEYDPTAVTYEELLDRYWTHIDPFDAGGQFADRGSQYRTAIFVLDDEQRRLAEASKAAMEARLGKPVAPLIEEASEFYVAEEYHHDYSKNNKVRYKMYYYGSGRGTGLKEIWGDEPSEEE